MDVMEMRRGLLICQKSEVNLFDRTSPPLETKKYINNSTLVGDMLRFTTHENYNVYSIDIKQGATYRVENIKANDPCTGFIDNNGIVTYIRRNGGGAKGTTFDITAPTSSTKMVLSVGINGPYKCDDVLKVTKL